MGIVTLAQSLDLLDFTEFAQNDDANSLTGEGYGVLVITRNLSAYVKMDKADQICLCRDEYLLLLSKSNNASAYC